MARITYDMEEITLEESEKMWKNNETIWIQDLEDNEVFHVRKDDEDTGLDDFLYSQASLDDFLYSQGVTDYRCYKRA